MNSIIPFSGLIMSSIVTVTFAKAPQQKMNVIYILADDLGYGNLSCTNQKMYETPHIDRLRREGMLFTNHYSGSTVSAPSRSSLMTGQHTGHTYIRGNRELKGQEGQLPLPEGTYTIAKMFQTAGYTTGAFGKWGLGGTCSTGDPNKMGFDSFFGYVCQRYAHRYYPPYLWDNGRKVTLDKNAMYELEQYAPDVIQNETIKFIEQNSKNPFFLFVPTTLPHVELIAPDDSLFNHFKKLYKEERPYVGAKGSAYDSQMDMAAYVSQSSPRAAYATMVVRLDNYVGEIMSTLRRLSLEDNTIVMFTSDNGSAQSEGGVDPHFFDSAGGMRGYKRDLYEGGIRLPLIAWSPRMIKQGTTSTHICAMWDMLPTFADIAQTKIPAPDSIDGISILPELTGKRQRQHRYLYWEYYNRAGVVAVRSGEWKYIVFAPEDVSKRICELYNLDNDPAERVNLVAEHPDVVAHMEAIMRQAHTPSEQFRFSKSKESKNINLN